MGATQSREDFLSSAPQARQNRQPRQLLDDEDYLEQIFRQLTGDGLHALRRVCRQWNAVALRMPHRLSSVEPRALPDVAAKFPNAVALRSRLQEVEGSVNTVMKDLAKFKQLQQLVLDVEILNRVRIHWRPFFRAMEGLVSLDISWNYGDWSTAFYAGLRRLTNLTSLTLYTCGQSHPKAPPLTELTKLQRLEICSKLLLNDKKVIFFSRLNCLTHLKFHRGLLEDENHTHTLTALLHYKKRLKSLTCDLADEEKDLVLPPQDDDRIPARIEVLRVTDVPWSKLAELHQLESLKLLNPGCLSSKFFAVLQTLTNLTELDMGDNKKGDFNKISKEALKSICSLVALKSLTLCHLGPFVVLSERRSPFFPLWALTKLVVRRGQFRTSLCCLDQLEHLQIENYWLKGDDLLETLNCMKCLRVLIIKRQRDLLIPTEVLAAFRGLRTLVLDVVLVDLGLFKCLATFPELQHLTLGCHPEEAYPDDFLIEINKLHHLTSLSFDCEAQYPMSHYLWTGSFPSLAELEVTDFTESERKELFRRLPLRTLKIKEVVS